MALHTPNKIKELGVIGYPLSQSISPSFQQAALDHLSLDIKYMRWEIDSSHIETFMKNIKRAEFLGSNVTVPYKQQVMGYLDEVDKWALEAGAVNTIVHRNGKLHGFNTDGQGFIKSLEEDGQLTLTNKQVLIIGAGGSARAVILSLATKGIGEIFIANRTYEKASQLSILAKNYGCKSRAIRLDDLTSVSHTSHLIINCTTMGMKHPSMETNTPLIAKDINPEAMVYDLVYNPRETMLMKEAKIAGAKTLGGLNMLVHQGAYSFHIWTGLKAPITVMYDAAQKAF